MIFNRKFIGRIIKPTQLAVYKELVTNYQAQVIESKSGVWNHQDIYSASKADVWKDWLFEENSVPGLSYNWYGGDWRSRISTGNIGSYPIGSAVATTISYGSRGDNYGFIGIGYFKPPTTGTYSFWTSSDDGSGVWVGTVALEGQARSTANAIVNNGMGAGQGDTKRGGSIALTGGKWYPIRIVHEEVNGGDNLTFSWAGPGIGETTALGSYFRTYSVNGVAQGKFVDFTF
jgi:hypothetical protein